MKNYTLELVASFLEWNTSFKEPRYVYKNATLGQYSTLEEAIFRGNGILKSLPDSYERLRGFEKTEGSDRVREVVAMKPHVHLTFHIVSHTHSDLHEFLGMVEDSVKEGLTKK